MLLLALSRSGWKKKSKVSSSNTPTLTIQTKKAIVLTLGFNAQTRWENPKYKEMI